MRYFAPNLLPQNKWFCIRENFEVDDLVLELDPNQKRSRVKLARLVAKYLGNDGLVRKVRIKTQGGEYDRPIHRLCLIATKEELNTSLSLSREEMNTNTIFSCYSLSNTIIL